MTAVLNILLEITVYSAVLCAVILFFQTAFHKAISAALNYAVWGILILRLLVPVTIDSGLHLFVIPEAPIQVRQADTAASDSSVQKQTVYQPVESTATYSSSYTPADGTIDNTILNTQDKPSGLKIDWQAGLVFLWAAGAIGSIIYVAICRKKLNKKIERYEIPTPEYVTKLVDKCKRDMRIKANIRVSVQGWTKSPALSSSIKPKLLIPEQMLESMDEKQIGFGVRHELTHYRRKDHLVNYLLVILRCVYWFNPVIYLAFRRVQVDMETACDAYITSELESSERSRYIRTMIDLGGSNIQYAIGMGVCRGRKAMERRIRGIFMKKRTGKGVRTAAAVLAGIMLVTCFTTACQPTPKANVVVNKGGDSIASAIAASPSSKYEVPKTWKDTFQRDGNKLAVDVDANILVPKVNAYPVITINANKFTQQQVDKIVKVLFQGKTVYNSSRPFTKSELEEKLLEAKAELAKKKADPQSSDDSIEDLEKIVKEIEAEIPGAPTSVDDKTASTLLQLDKYGEIRLDIKADLGKKQNATLSIINQEDSNPLTCSLSFVNTDTNGTYSSFENYNLPDSTPIKLKISKDDAVSKARDLLNKLDITGMDVTAVFPGIISGSEGEDVSHNPQCYMVYFGRTVNGFPTTFAYRYDGTSGGAVAKPATKDLKGSTPPDYRPPWAEEQILVCVDDSGIPEFNWQSPANIKGNASDNASLIPFDQIKKLFEEQMFLRYSFGNKTGDDNMISKCTYHIEKVTLGLARIDSKNNLNDYLLVPVWDFYGSIQYDYDMDAVTSIMKEHDPKNVDEHIKWYKNQNGVPVSGGSRSFVTINALDGSVID